MPCSVQIDFGDELLSPDRQFPVGQSDEHTALSFGMRGGLQVGAPAMSTINE